MSVFKIFKKRSITISPEDTDRFLNSIIKLYENSPPLGKRGRYDFGNQFDGTYNELELLVLKYCLIIYNLSALNFDRQLIVKIQRRSYDYIVQMLNNSLYDINVSSPPEFIDDRMKFYSEFFKFILIDNNTEPNMFTINFAKITYTKLFNVRYKNMSESEMHEWLGDNLYIFDFQS